MEVLGDGGEYLTPAGMKERIILALLALAAPHPVSPDRLVDVLWSDAPPGNPGNALQARVSALRKSLGAPGMIDRVPAGYVLKLDRENIDVHRFDWLVTEARREAERGAPGQALALLVEASDLWRGDPLADFAFENFARPVIARLDDARLEAEEARLQLMVDHGREEEAVGIAERLLESHPFREGIWALLMLALYRSGRQSDALAAYKRARETLVEELGLDPGPELQELEEAILTQDPSLAQSARGVQTGGNLPARLTSFLGRVEELAEVRRSVRQNRLVTLVGPGGVGKTSLAIAAAEGLHSLFLDGVWFVELASLSEPDLVADEVARGLGLRPMAGHGDEAAPDPVDLLIDHVSGREMLLIMDNCEHVVDAAAVVIDRLTKASAGLTVLATSREPLRLPGEVVWPTPPLSAPHGEMDVADLASFDSVALFVERAREVRPDFVLDALTAPAVSIICQQLDGLPLALELAASRVRALPVREIAARLHDRFVLLTGGSRTTPPRQQTLRAAIEWSHDMLSENERALFRRLSVFAGGWTLEAATETASDDRMDADAILDLLASLVDRSLVIFDSGAERYRMLETIREYGAQMLDEAGERTLIERRHAAYFCRFAESAELHGPDQTRWVHRLDEDIDNLRAAISNAVTHGECDTALRLGGALGWYWFFDRMNEGRARLDSILSSCTKADLWARAAALQARAMVIFDLSPDPVARSAARESARIFEELGDLRRTAESLCLVALDGWFGADPAEPLEMIRRARNMYAALNDDWGEAFSRFVELLAICKHGDLDEAVRQGELSVAAFQVIGDPWAMMAVPAHLGEILRWKGDYARAKDYVQRALEGSDTLGLTHVAMYCIYELGQLNRLTGDTGRAMEWFEKGAARADELGYGYWRAAFGCARADGVAVANPDLARSLYLEAQTEAERAGLSAAQALAGLAELELHEGALGAAVERLAAGAEQATAMADLSGLIRCLIGLVEVAGRVGDHHAVARLVGRVEAVTARIGTFPPTLEAARERALRSLGLAQYEAAVELGASQAIEELASIDIG